MVDVSSEVAEKTYDNKLEIGKSCAFATWKISTNSPQDRHVHTRMDRSSLAEKQEGDSPLIHRGGFTGKLSV